MAALLAPPGQGRIKVGELDADRVVGLPAHEPLALLRRAGLQRRPGPAAGEQTAIAVPNEPAPITTARREPGDGKLAWFDRGPFSNAEPPSPLAGFWSSYFYNGYIYGSEIQRGFDVFRFTDPAVAGLRAYKMDTLNVQTQYPQGKPGHRNGRS